jgi:hypothetical protein
MLMYLKSKNVGDHQSNINVIQRLKMTYETAALEIK